jgi:hypothetical protein
MILLALLFKSERSYKTWVLGPNDEQEDKKIVRSAREQSFFIIKLFKFWFFVVFAQKITNKP